MLRTILGVIAGYLSMTVFVVTSIAITWFGLGPEFAFQGDSVAASTGWSLIILAAGFVAAIVGGLVASLVAGKANQKRTIIGLLSLMCILGTMTAAFQMITPVVPLPDGKTIATLTFAEAGQYARSPNWYNVAIIFVGIAGVLTGAKLVAKPDQLRT